MRLKKSKYSLLERLKIYLNISTHFVIGILLSLLIGSIIGSYDRGIGSFIGFISVVVCYFKYHIDLSRKVMSSRLVMRIIKTTILVIAGLSLVVFKIYVNENIHSGIAFSPSQQAMMYGYLFFSFWTTLFLWEIGYQLSHKEKT